MRGGVVVAVEDVLQAQCHVPVRQGVEQGRVDGGVARHHHVVVQRRVAVVNVVGAGGDAPLRGEAAYQPEVGAVARGERRYLREKGGQIYLSTLILISKVALE